MVQMIRTIKQVASYVYDTLGPGHEEAVYRDAMSIELQDRGYTVKTEAPVSIKYKTKKGKEMIVGGAKIDLYITKFLIVSTYLYNEKDIDIFDFLSFSRPKKSNSKREKEFEDWINKKIDEEMDKENDEENFYDDIEQNNEQQLEKKYSKVLGLSGGESIKDIENSYRKLIKMYHPDKVASMGKEIIKTAEENPP